MSWRGQLTGMRWEGYSDIAAAFKMFAVWSWRILAKHQKRDMTKPLMPKA